MSTPVAETAQTAQRNGSARGRSYEALVPLSLCTAIGIGSFILFQPYLRHLLLVTNTSVPPAVLDRQIGLMAWMAAAESLVGAAVGAAIAAGLARVVITMGTLARTVTTPAFGATFTLAAWAQVAGTAKQLAYWLAAPDPTSVRSARDLLPAISFGALVEDRTSPIYLLAESANIFDLASLVIFCVLLERRCGLTPGRAFAAAAVPWAVLTGSRVLIGTLLTT